MFIAVAHTMTHCEVSGGKFEYCWVFTKLFSVQCYPPVPSNVCILPLLDIFMWCPQNIYLATSVLYWKYGWFLYSFETYAMYNLLKHSSVKIVYGVKIFLWSLVTPRHRLSTANEALMANTVRYYWTLLLHLEFQNVQYELQNGKFCLGAEHESVK